MAEVLVRYYASARVVSSVPEESLTAVTVADAVNQIGARHGARMEAILTASSLLLDGVRVSDYTIDLLATSQLDVLPPFAGG